MTKARRMAAGCARVAAVVTIAAAAALALACMSEATRCGR